MINETFVASNPKMAYDEAVKKYGTSIKLVSAKQIKHDDGEVWCEVAVSIPEELFMEKSALNETNEEESEENAILLSELETLKEQLMWMQQEMKKSLEPDTQEKVKQLFLDKGIASVWLEKVLQSLMGSNVLEDRHLLVSYLLEEIDASMLVYEESLEESKIMMLVGPTGVGKTTTIAKLAARYAYLMEKPYRVALLNLDSYKVGAYEQLAHYADIMQLEHITVNGVEEFKEALSTLSGYDIVLIDTAGMSPYDTQKFIKVVEFVQVEMAMKIEVNLVIPATIKYEDMGDVYSNFSFLNLSSVIVSKFDETKHFGTLLNFMLLYNIPMSYFSTGQEVPDDLILASKEYLLEHFIGDLDEA